MRAVASNAAGQKVHINDFTRVFLLGDDEGDQFAFRQLAEKSGHHVFRFPSVVPVSGHKGVQNLPYRSIAVDLIKDERTEFIELDPFFQNRRKKTGKKAGGAWRADYKVEGTIGLTFRPYALVNDRLRLERTGSIKNGAGRGDAR